ncbi:hypothetical protein DE146DRAFT_647236 [Phaeosphaeria sp. MPI-PUGE-AT-0046c]|nr:hypothetical protein DE146DRAFT_647236 [Phaeosphaeria sp. MPI-PUGE-AT-0046c]
MHISFAISTLLAGLAAAQTFPACTMEAARSDDCAAVINANACYNKFKWNAQTLTCIDGTDTKLKQQKVSLVSRETNRCMTDRLCRCASVAPVLRRPCATGRRSRSSVETF